MLKPLSALTTTAAMMMGGAADAAPAEWQRSKFKLTEGRWVLGSERAALTAAPAPGAAAAGGR